MGPKENSFTSFQVSCKKCDDWVCSVSHFFTCPIHTNHSMHLHSEHQNASACSLWDSWDHTTNTHKYYMLLRLNLQPPDTIECSSRDSGVFWHVRIRQGTAPGIWKCSLSQKISSIPNNTQNLSYWHRSICDTQSHVPTNPPHHSDWSGEFWNKTPGGARQVWSC